MKLRRSNVKRFESVMEEETPPSAPDPAPEALDSDFVKLQLGSLKKPKKKSRISVARAAFEDG